jgi:uncharacterized protein (TIGR03435 family)
MLVEKPILRTAVFMSSVLIRPLAAMLMAAGLAIAQNGEAPPAFEVASVKPAGPLDPAKLMSGQQRLGVTLDAARVDMRSLSLGDLIRTAYQVKAYQISGPAWMETQRYDIVAKLPEGGKRGQIPAMLQTLLAERFHLLVHRSSSDVPAFALVVAKSGPRLKESPAEPAADTTGVAGAGGNSALRFDAALDPKGVVTTTGPNGTVRQTTGPKGMHLDIQAMPMRALAEYLGRFKGGPVTDMTGLQGKYDFVLDLSREELVEVARSSGQAISSGAGDPNRALLDVAEDPGTSLASSLDLLGLKLEPRKSSVEMLVIDRVEKVPIEN